MSEDRVKAASELIATRQMNCAQAVLNSYCEDLGLDKNIALRLAQGFGAGMGRTDNICGAVSGAYMVLGLRPYPEIEDRRARMEHVYQLIQDFNRLFTAKNKSLKCTDLTGCDLSTAEGLNMARSQEVFTGVCPGLVGDAVSILETLLHK
jgi:C_GCAxxG_C_C family probable redox protein